MSDTTHHPTAHIKHCDTYCTPKNFKIMTDNFKGSSMTDDLDSLYIRLYRLTFVRIHELFRSVNSLQDSSETNSYSLCLIQCEIIRIYWDKEMWLNSKLKTSLYLEPIKGNTDDRTDGAESPQQVVLQDNWHRLEKDVMQMLSVGVFQQRACAAKQLPFLMNTCSEIVCT